MKTIYFFNNLGRFVGTGSIGNEDPVPANATEVAPPSLNAIQQAVFDKVNKTWSIVSQPSSDPDTFRVLSKYQFRQLLTLEERLLLDALEADLISGGDGSKVIADLPTRYMDGHPAPDYLRTLFKDFGLSDVVYIDSSTVFNSLVAMEELGILAPGRALEITKK